MRLCLFLASFVFSLAASAQTTIVDSIQSGGIWRNYRLYLPANYNANTTQRPLILNLHGLGSDAEEQENYGDFRPIADTAGFLVVHPNGTTVNGYTYWNVGLNPFGANDVTFLSALIDTLSARYRVDAQRVFSAGMSNGGFMSYYLASYLSQKIAAIASVTGSISTASYPPPVPTHPMPVLQMHGTADATVPYGGGPTVFPGVSSVPIDTLVNFWITFNGANASPQTTAIPDINAADGCTATRFVYTGGASGSTVEFFKITGGGHTWPGSPFPFGITNQDFSASQEIWRFFRQYSLSGLLSTKDAKASKAAPRLRAVPNPARQSVRIEGATGGIAEVLDMTGRSVAVGRGQSINVASLPSGTYQLRYTTAAQVGTVMFVKE